MAEKVSEIVLCDHLEAAMYLVALMEMAPDAGPSVDSATTPTGQTYTVRLRNPIDETMHLGILGAVRKAKGRAKAEP